MSEKPMTAGVLAFAHIGDLHLTDAKQRNFTDFLSIVAQIETQCGASLDFVVLPGDNADNGLPSQYALAATALKMLSLPVHVIPGDHDMEQGSLTAFYAGLGSDPLPKAVTVQGTRCLFLDISGPGGGGPDFRLGSDQLAWLERELRDAKLRQQTSVVFTHTYPDDLRGEGETEAMNGLLAGYDVALVDLGHTHYNELANDGRTVFAATRSTGQIEEGPVGYSIATLDAGQVSWRFKPLDDAFPFVIITAPADHRLLREGNGLLDRSCTVRALVIGREAIRSVSCRTEDGSWIAMSQASGERVWTAELAIPTDRLVTIEVQAVDATGRPGQHAIRAATTSYSAPTRARLGSDAASIGAWPENGIFGTQLGPNRNGAASS
ncbi:metallophosphoesterase family protein [Lichenifustis flavocetrariae]|uniref:Metallophosphoesterase n=1 Tax=Lichenifustis flavocetrariae TaxID=2949735 RepID=A0AA41YUT6_9HYPH|nr:metallophosphoesterase [Lichenifustis flavocetrariae]MCW6508961.1 metallophosphoesterase [Lichenifustis flavocetrariae]